MKGKSTQLKFFRRMTAFEHAQSAEEVVIH